MSSVIMDVLVAEQELGERLGELGLAHARGAQEDERAGRTLGVLEAGAGAADGLADGLDGLVLADDPTMCSSSSMRRSLAVSSSVSL
jgi:hypothetical protein